MRVEQQGQPHRGRSRRDPSQGSSSRHSQYRTSRRGRGSPNSSFGRDSEAEFRRFRAEQVWEEMLEKKKGYLVKKIKGDGNCLFRAFAEQIFGDQELHADVRKMACDYMEKGRDVFAPYVGGDFTEYVNRKRKNGVYGNHLEIQAVSELFNRPVIIYEVGKYDPINIFHVEYETENPPIRLAFVNKNHYHAIIDPSRPAVGIGLGMPGLKASFNQNDVMKAAVHRSEEEELENVLVRDVILTADQEDTQQEIMNAVLMLSQMEFFEQRSSSSPSISIARSPSSTGSPKG